MMRRLLVAVVAAAGCGSPSAPATADAYVPLDAPAHAGPGPGGGLLDELRFAVVGDTRPANLDDTAGYPTAIVQQIFTDVEAETPKPLFAVTTGDYMFAATTGAQVGPQLDLYLGARGSYTGLVYPAMGNHECNGYTKSNCGPAGTDGEPPNYQQFMSRMIDPIGEGRPYFIERFAATDGSWSAKFVFVAANAWDKTQQAWLETMLGEPTTYTFVVRHEPPESNTAPGVDPSQMIMVKHPMTMLIAGHTHTYRHVPAYREIIVGNGGAPLTSGTNFGYVIVARQPDGTLDVTSKDSQTLAAIDHFVVTANGLAP
jgi:calcineurin-like phosphoesterase family protein